MENLKKIAIILIVCIVVIIGILLIIFNKEDKTIQQEEFGSYENGGDQINLSKNIEKVTNPTIYYTVNNCMEDYLKVISTNINNNEEYIEGGEINFLQLNNIYTEEEKNKYIYNLLSINYIQNRKIDINNVNEFIIDIDTADNYIINKMYQIEGEKISYYVLNINVDNFKNLNYKIILDNENNTYMIEPLDNIDIDNISVDDIVYQDLEKINKNENNTFEFNRIDNQEMAKRYFYNYKMAILNNVQSSFYLLEKEYREKRFGTLTNYVEYIQENEENIKNIKIKQFLINDYDDYTEYVCKDQNENLYIFKAEAVMDYTLQLDTYTIDLPSFVEKYNKSTEQEKVGMNIEKVISAINSKDYKYVYNKLDDNFKNNNFENLDLFIKYIQNSFFEYNETDYKEFKSLAGVYTYNFKLIDKNNPENIKDFTIIMKLLDNLDFVMSFQI